MNPKKFWDPTRPGNPSTCPAHIFSNFFTSEMLKFAFLSMKELFYMPGSVLVEYKWAKMETFFRTPKTVRCPEVPEAQRVRRNALLLVK